MAEHSCLSITTCHTSHGFSWVRDGRVGTGYSGFFDTLNWYPRLNDLYIGKTLQFLVDFSKAFTESSCKCSYQLFR